MISERKTIICLYVAAILFIIASMVGIWNESYIITLIPFGLALCFLALLALDKLLLIIMFFTPLSLELSEIVPNMPFNMSLPTEPFIFLTMCMFFIKLLSERRFDKEVLKHPVTICIYVYLGWLSITCLTSEMPVVSLKYLLTRLWFISCFYFIVTQFVVNEKNIVKYIIAYVLGFTFVILYTLINHAPSYFSHDTSYRVMQPFFKDHTSYGAALALLIPAMIVVIKRTGKDFSIKFFNLLLLGLLCIALLFSYTRAAWAGILGVFALWTVLKLRIKIKTLIISALTAIILIAPFYNDIIYKMSKNTEVSSTNFLFHLKSVSNISSDDSNTERINRWKCALRMFADKPITGFGPGTYMFKYAPYQHSEDRTKISTNAADLGNAHSEYLGLLADAGLFGALSFIAILITVLITGFNLYNTTKDELTKETVLFLLLGLITYYLHAFLNDFLDMDKIASLFWGFIAIIVMLDIKNKHLSDEAHN
ncbi:MAG: O-antigen ligase family protein [Bacteroidales bacterium]|nr:O-antigen ligase family protein [Bacteroidales bacterium]